MSYTVAQDSRIGGREVNQDRAAWHATSDAVLLLVADGMGGHLQGEVAAQLAVETVAGCFKRIAKPRVENVPQFLVSALQMAHSTIVRYGADCLMPPHAAPRTTCIACVVQDGVAHWAHAGDSRLYLIHGQSPLPLGAGAVAKTRDHSVVQRMFDQGQISYAEMAEHPLRHHVFSCLGGDTKPHIEVSPPVRLADRDVIALCTDGAWSLLEGELAARLSSSRIETAVPELLEFAASRGGPQADNLTMIALCWHAPDPDVATTRPEQEGIVKAPERAISDAEIDAAIADIRQRLTAGSVES